MDATAGRRNRLWVEIRHFLKTTCLVQGIPKFIFPTKTQNRFVVCELYLFYIIIAYYIRCDKYNSMLHITLQNIAQHGYNIINLSLLTMPTMNQLVGVMISWRWTNRCANLPHSWSLVFDKSQEGWLELVGPHRQSDSRLTRAN